jgi:hypothetical protein
MTDFLSVSNDIKLGKGVKLSKFINLYGCEVTAVRLNFFEGE